MLFTCLIFSEYTHTHTCIKISEIKKAGSALWKTSLSDLVHFSIKKKVNRMCSSVKITIVYLIVIALNLYIHLISIVIFTMLIFPVQEYGISLYLFESSLISFVSVF